MERLTNKVVLITGSSSGIGKTTAIRCAEEGANVVVTFNSGRERAEQVVDCIKGLGRDAMAAKLDICNKDDIRQMVDSTINHFGRIDVFVNCTGGHHPGHPGDMSSLPDEYFFDNLFEVNLKGPYLCAAAIIPHMQAQHSGSIVFTSSTAKDGIQQAPDYRDLTHRVGYSASKEGTVGMTWTMANYLAESGIRVNCVVPGPISDDANRKRNYSFIPLARQGSTLEVATAIAYLASDEASYITGQILYVSGGWHGGGFSPEVIKMARRAD